MLRDGNWKFFLVISCKPLVTPLAIIFIFNFRIMDNYWNIRSDNEKILITLSFLMWHLLKFRNFPSQTLWLITSLGVLI